MAGQKKISLGDYLWNRLTQFEDCYSRLDRPLSETIPNPDEFKDRQSELGQLVFQREFRQADPFRKMALVGLCAFLEEGTRMIAKKVVPDYAAAIKKTGNGNWLRKNVALLVSQSGLDILPISSELNEFDRLLLLRNCIAHSWANVEESDYSDQVKEAVANVSDVEITKDGILFVGQDVLPEAIDVAHRILNHLLEGTTGESID